MSCGVSECLGDGTVSPGQRMPLLREIGRQALELHCAAALVPGVRPQIASGSRPF
jgi:hypothetical protein